VDCETSIFAGWLVVGGPAAETKQESWTARHQPAADARITG